MINLAREILGVLFAGLWQGALIAGIAAAALAGLRRASASTRHAVLWCALLAIAVIPLITALQTRSVVAAGSASASGVAAAQTIATIQSADAPTAREIQIDVIDSVVLVLCALWVAGVV